MKKYNYCVYKLIIDDKYVYIGSSQNIIDRINSHKRHVLKKDNENLYLYDVIRSVGGWSKVKHIILAKNLSSRQEAYELEYKFINIYPENILLNRSKKRHILKLLK